MLDDVLRGVGSVGPVFLAKRAKRSEVRYLSLPSRPMERLLVT